MDIRPSDDRTADDAHWEALARFYAGESPPEEIQAVSEWLASQEKQENALNALDGAVMRLAAASQSEIDVDGALRAVKARDATPDVRSIASARARQSPAAPWRNIGLVAAAAVVIATGVVLSKKKTPDAGPTTYPARVVATAVGHLDSLRLPDSSLVVLGPSSTLTIPAGFGASDRQVALRGEAYFDVTHDSTKPFSVSVSGAVIRDLGTSFTVQGDSGQTVRVVVTAGAVIVRRASQSTGGVRLDATDLATVDASGNIATRRGAATAADVAWRSGTLDFDDATLVEVRDALRRWYGADLQFNKSMAARHVSAKFTGDSLPQVAAVLGRTLGLRVELRGTTIILSEPPTK